MILFGLKILLEHFMTDRVSLPNNSCISLEYEHLLVVLSDIAREVRTVNVGLEL